MHGTCICAYDAYVSGDACACVVCAYMCIIHVCVVMHVCMVCAWHVYVYVVMHVHMGMHVCVTHACVWSDACVYGACKYCGACICVEHACVWQCMSCVDAHVCTCTHLLDRLISDILYGPLSLRSLTELNTGSESE